MKWKRPSLHDEIGELERTAHAFGFASSTLKIAYDTGRLVKLSELIWSQLENSDSYFIDSIDAAQEVAASYDRSINSILDANVLPAPIVMKHKNGYYLVAGNTRLMVARALSLVPYVYLIEIAT